MGLLIIGSLVAYLSAGFALLLGASWLTSLVVLFGAGTAAAIAIAVVGRIRPSGIPADQIGDRGCFDGEGKHRVH